MESWEHNRQCSVSFCIETMETHPLTNSLPSLMLKTHNNRSKRSFLIGRTQRSSKLLLPTRFSLNQLKVDQPKADEKRTNLFCLKRLHSRSLDGFLKLCFRAYIVLHLLPSNLNDWEGCAIAEIILDRREEFHRYRESSHVGAVTQELTSWFWEFPLLWYALVNTSHDRERPPNELRRPIVHVPNTTLTAISSSVLMQSSMTDSKSNQLTFAFRHEQVRYLSGAPG